MAAAPHRRAGLKVRQLDGEAVVYDIAHHSVYYLNESALALWQRADGAVGVEALFSRSVNALRADEDVEQYVRSAIDTMVDTGLLDRDLPLSPSCEPC